MDNALIDGLDKDEWSPPVPPLSISEIQRGVYPVFSVKTERASQPFNGELEHWSALPALSYFALNAVALRETMRRIAPPTTFRPPPRLTLSDRRKESWFAELADPHVPLRQLSRAVPHGYTSLALLDVLLERHVPVNRAVWFVKCVGANQVRALKRKLTSGAAGASMSALGRVEQSWLLEWTGDVIEFITRIIDSYDDQPQQWKQNMKFASRLTIGLYSARLLDQAVFLEWLLSQLRESPLLRLPCLVHLVQLLWKPLTGAAMAHKLFRSIAHRFSSQENGCKARLNAIMEPIVLKLATTNEDAFVTPRSWPIIEPHIRSHPAYVRLVERNQSFVMADPHGPSDWTLLLEAGALMENFLRPYRVDELVASLLALDLDVVTLIRTILTWTVRQGTNASIQLCISLLRRIGARDASLPISGYCVDFLFDPHLIHDSDCLGCLVSELLTFRLCHLGLYVNRVIASGILYTSGRARELHLRVLRDLPFDKLAPSIRAQIEMILHKVGAPVESADLEPYVSSAWNLFGGKPWPELDVGALSVNDRQRLAVRLIGLYEKLLSSEGSSASLTPASLVQFVNVVECAGCGSMRPLFRILTMTLASSRSGPGLVSCVLRQVHVRLMAFVCSGLVDAFVTRLVAKLQWSAFDLSGAVSHGLSRAAGESHEHAVSLSTVHEENDVFQWVSWDDISALRAVIQTPSIMVELNRLVPLRQTHWATSDVTGHTPNDQDTVKQLLYRPGSPDIGALLSLRGEECLASSIVEYAQSPGADRAALLQLVAYRAVKIEELGSSDPDKFAMLRYLLLEPTNELGFSLEEVDVVRAIRKEYLESIDIEELFALSSSVIPMRFLSRIAHIYPDVFTKRMLWELIDSPKFSPIILNDTKFETRCFEELLIRCTPFNLRYYQGLTLIAFHEKSVDEITAQVFQSAFAHPEASSALQGLLQNVKYEAKDAIFTKTLETFLHMGLDTSQLPLVDVYITLIAALAPSIKGPVQWNLDLVPEFLKKLVEEATEVSKKPPAIGCNDQWSEVVVLRKALSLVLRISVIGRLHNVALPAAALPYLEKLLHIQVFADNYRVRTFIKDSLRLLLRIASTAETLSSLAVDADLSSTPNVLDGLKLFSKSKNSYTALPVWVFDLIEDASPNINQNDGPVDLSYFEAYED